MTEENSTISPAGDEPADPLETEEVALDGIEDEGESSRDSVDEILNPANVKAGDCSEEDLAPLRATCANADQKYHQVLSYLEQFQEAQDILQRFQARDKDLTPLDVNKAKKEFHKAKKLYIEAGNEINEGIKPIHKLARMWREDLLVQNLYKTYLAKLLASLQARNPTEPFVELLAAGGFDFERNEVTMDDREAQRGLTLEQKKKEMLEATAKTVGMLETRYFKRQLQNRLRLGENPRAIIKNLKRLLKRDPEDVNTFIWLAKLTTDQYQTERNQNTRVALRDDILTYCKKAFALIDDFLTVQGIHDQNDRDKRRSSYVRSITQIRKPLLVGES